MLIFLQVLKEIQAKKEAEMVQKIIEKVSPDKLDKLDSPARLDSQIMQYRYRQTIQIRQSSQTRQSKQIRQSRQTRHARQIVKPD